MDFGANLKSIRELRRLTQDELAEKIKARKQNISGWENNKGRPGKKYLDRLAEALDVKVSRLYEGEIDENPTSDRKLSTGLYVASVDDQRKVVKGEREKYRRAGMIPLYDTVSVGGSEFLKADDSAVLASNHEWIHAGPFVGRATGAIRHYGDSMYEKFPSGCIIAYAGAPDWREYLHYGSDYVVETRDGYRVTKNVQPQSDSKILLVSHNTYKNKHGIEIYSPYTVPMKMIRSMSYVLGMVRFDASMGPVSQVELESSI